MNKQHTPGPWRVEIEDGTPVIWAHPNKYDIAVVALDWEPVRHHGQEDIDNGTMAGNARLIAAAPDLLAALESLVAIVTEETTKFPANRVIPAGLAVSAAAHAIARAKWEAHE